MHKNKAIIVILILINMIMLCGISEKIKANTSKNVSIDNILDEGIYTIKSFDNENFVLDVEGASTQQCANILLYQNQ